MGASSFHFFKAELSEKSYLDSKLFQEDRHRQTALLGLSQSAVYYREPEITLNKYFPQSLLKPNHQKFILSLGAEKTFADYRPKANLPLTLAIGPERGWTQDEEIMLEHMNFLPVKISRSTLRVEHATFSALAQLEQIFLTQS